MASYPSRRVLLVAVVATVLLVAVVAVTVWPTRYRFLQTNGAFLRINRLTGVAQVLDPDRGCIPIPEDTVPARVNPFDTLPDLADTTRPSYPPVTGGGAGP